jgi:hypothetical protein
MDYTITELTDGKAVVTFADGAWASVPVVTDDTKETFEERVQWYATKIPQSNPAWIAVSQTGSVTQVEFSVATEEETGNPAWLDARIAAYGPTSSQIEFITENGLAAWQTEVTRIKTLHPQPE